MGKNQSFSKKILIAEMCQNHNGRLEVLEEMVEAASVSGATHAKIQGIYASELVFRERFEQGGGAGVVRPFHAEQERLAGLELSLDAERVFIKWCERFGITPMITIFSHSGLDRAVASGFQSFKIASYDCSSRSLIERALPHATELVVSTGGTQWVDVVETCRLLMSRPPGVEVTLLHAVTKYPTLLAEVNLARMLSLGVFGFPIGFSDHTSPGDSGLVASLSAVYLGASAIERHFSILSPSETRDGPVSVSPSELKEIRSAMMLDEKEAREKLLQSLSKNPEILLSHGVNPTEIEVANADYYRGRFASWQNGNQVMAWEPW